MSTVPVTIHVVNDSVVAPAVLNAVVVRFYNEDGSVFVTQTVTDVYGDAVLDLEEGVYWVRLFKVGYEFASRCTVDVDAAADTDTFDVVATDLTVLPPAVVPELCRVSGFVCDPSLSHKAGVIVTFTLTGKPRIVSGLAMVPQDLVVVSDSRGWVEVDLVRKGLYDCVIAGQDDTVYRVVVPDRTSVSVTDAIWPYASSLEYDEASVVVPVGSSATVPVKIVLSSGAETPYEVDTANGSSLTVDVDSYVTLLVSDASVVTISLVDGLLTVTGVVAGTATITAVLRDPPAEAERLPAPTRSFQTLAVTVI